MENPLVSGAKVTRELDILEVVNDRVEERGKADDESDCLCYGSSARVYKSWPDEIRVDPKKGRRGRILLGYGLI